MITIVSRTLLLAQGLAAPRGFQITRSFVECDIEQQSNFFLDGRTLEIVAGH